MGRRRLDPISPFRHSSAWFCLYLTELFPGTSATDRYSFTVCVRIVHTHLCITPSDLIWGYINTILMVPAVFLWACSALEIGLSEFSLWILLVQYHLSSSSPGSYHITFYFFKIKKVLSCAAFISPCALLSSHIIKLPGKITFSLTSEETL